MEAHYPKYANLEAFAKAARDLAEGRGRVLNLFITGELYVNALRNEPLADVTKKAQLWQAPILPDELLINHGFYIGESGITHIIEELQRKASSNRALYSLIDQKVVLDSGDDPIPSFMIFQCGLHEGILYCTSYFRALEVADFLRINLEEMRLNLIKIVNAFMDVTTVRLSVFAFSAYNNPGQAPLERSALDLMDRLDIDDAYREDRNSIALLLDAKAAQTTVVDLRGLESIREWLSPERKRSWPKDLTNVPAIIHEVNKAVELGQSLAILRKSNSHHPVIAEATVNFVNSIRKLAEEFRK